MRFVHPVQDVPNLKVGHTTLDEDPWCPAVRQDIEVVKGKARE